MKSRLNKKNSYIIIFLILIVLLVINLYIIVDYKDNFDEYLEYQDKTFQNSISEIFHTYEEFSNFIFETEVNTDDVKQLMYDAEQADEDERTVLRNELYDKYEEIYNSLIKYNFRQFHFHFKNGDSFLRMHYPEKYGDNLFSIRESVKIVNEEQHFVSGFEEGRIFNGYRYVYPLNYKGTHVGSVELSISVESVLKELYAYNEGRDVAFIIKKDIVEAKVFEVTKINYELSSVSEDYYIDIEVYEDLKELENGISLFDNEEFLLKIKEKVRDELYKGESFSLGIKNEDIYYLVQFSAIENVSGENIGYFISIVPDEQIDTMKKNNIQWIVFSILAMFFTIYLIVILVKKQEEVQRLAMTDQLTKIYNRRFFFEIAEKEVKKSYRDQSDTCIAMLDIDHFKRVNDTYGHLEGDRVLKSLATLIEETLRSADVIARYGGEEFVLLMPHTNILEADIVLERVRREVETYDFSPVPKITISIGFMKINMSKQLSENIDGADEALYIAKKTGRNRVIENKKWSIEKI